MSLFTAPFIPSINKEGEAKLTFVGLEIKTGRTKLEGREYQINNLKFECMGKVRGTSTFISITSGKTFDIQSGFCKALVNMGLKPQILMDIYNQIFEEVELVTDGDGFEVEDCPEDDDGFAVTDEREFDFSEIEKFCLLNCRNVFVGKVFQNDKKYWEIDPETVKPLTKHKAEKEKKSGKKSTKKSVDSTEQETEENPKTEETEA